MLLHCYLVPLFSCVSVFSYSRLAHRNFRLTHPSTYSVLSISLDCTHFTLIHTPPSLLTIFVVHIYYPAICTLDYIPLSRSLGLDSSRLSLPYNLIFPSHTHPPCIRHLTGTLRSTYLLAIPLSRISSSRIAVFSDTEKRCCGQSKH